MNIKITGSGSYIPSEIVTNKDFIKQIGIIDYGIIEIIEENRKSLYGIISKKLYKQYNLDINTKNHNLENKMKLFSNYL